MSAAISRSGTSTAGGSSRWLRCALDVEQVADALERPDAAGLARRGAELAADAAHPDAQVLQVVAVLRAPDLGQELGVEDDLAGVRGEVLEEQPLGARQLHELAVPGDHAPLEVDLDVVELDDAGARLGPAGAADDRAHARRQLVGMERLGDVVVGAEVEALRLVGRRALRRQQDDRHGPALAQLAHDLDAVEVGHDDVQQDDVRPDLLRLLERLLATVGGDDAEALLGQGDGHELGDARLVVGDEHQWLGRHWMPPCGASVCIVVARISAMLPGPCQAAIVTAAVCRAVRADIAEPLRAHYNASVHDREAVPGRLRDMPVRGAPRRAEAGPRRESAVAYASARRLDRARRSGGTVPDPRAAGTPADDRRAPRLRIAQVAPPLERVPPTAYGGTERIVHELTTELVRRGHDVTVFASGDSDVPCRLIPTVETALRPGGHRGRRRRLVRRRR